MNQEILNGKKLKRGQSRFGGFWCLGQPTGFFPHVFFVFPNSQWICEKSSEKDTEPFSPFCARQARRENEEREDAKPILAKYLLACLCHFWVQSEVSLLEDDVK